MVEIVHFAILYCIPLVLLTVLYFIMCRYDKLTNFSFFFLHLAILLKICDS